MQRIGTYFAIVLALIIVFISGCGKAEKHAENEIAKGLQQRLGPAKSYDVNITGSPLRLLKGKMERLDIVGKEVHLQKGITIANLSVTINDLVFDPDTKAIKGAGRTIYSATLDQDELAKYLHKTYPDVPDLKIALREGFIDVSARPAVAGVGVNIKTESDLHVENHHLLILDLKKISAAGISAPEFARNYIETKVNPIFNSKDLGFDATINSLTLGRGSINIGGNLNLVDLKP